MILNLIYLMMGITIGVIIRYEIDLKARRKRTQQRVLYFKSTASELNIKQYDEILNSIKSINESLSAMNQSKQHKKEVR
jgi:hypothetical protein